jgi:hypothetical protein
MHRRYTWEKAKEKLQHYRRRSPEASPLYQIVYHSRDDLSIQWESRFQAHYGCLRDEVVKTFDEYLNCGLLAHGAARVYCDGCKHSLLIAFSCKRRGVCPSCGAKRAVKFAEHIYSEVIEDAPHRHTVFTIPKRIRVFFKYDRKLNTILFRAAWGALSQVLGIDERELAAIFTVQTAGEALNYHPHLHGLLADGYWKDGVFTRFEELELKAIEEAFAERVLAQLHKQELITDDDVAQILSQDHLLWCRATLDLTDSSAQQAKTTQKNKPVQSSVQSCPVPVELLSPVIAFVLFGRRREELNAFAPSPTGIATVVSRTPYQLGYVPTVLRS